MSLPSKLLGNGEAVVLHLRRHWRVLVGPVLVLLVLAAALGAGVALIPREWRPWADIALGIMVLILFCWFVLTPLLRWRTTTYTFTNRRIITRSGIFTTVGHDLPLARINDMSYERSFIDKLFGSGTLVLQTAADDPLSLTKIPDVERVHVEMTELLFGSHELSGEADD